MIKTKCAWATIDRKNDGLRILVTRYWVRKLKKAACDVWMPNLGPSEPLLKSYDGGKITWEEFSKRYSEELREGGSIDKRNRTIKNHGQKFTLRLLQKLGQRGKVTLLCHCAERATECHRHLLKKILDGKI